MEKTEQEWIGYVQDVRLEYQDKINELTAENGRLQQQLKEKDENVDYEKKRLYEKCAELTIKLKSARELNRELVNDIGKLIQKLIVRHNGTSAIIKIVNELESLIKKSK